MSVEHGNDRCHNGHDPVALSILARKMRRGAGSGIGDLPGQAFRIAIGPRQRPMILGTLGVIEVALNALDIRTARAARGRDRMARRECECVSCLALGS